MSKELSHKVRNIIQKELNYQVNNSKNIPNFSKKMGRIVFSLLPKRINLYFGEKLLKYFSDKKYNL